MHYGRSARIYHLLLMIEAVDATVPKMLVMVRRVIVYVCRLKKGTSMRHLMSVMWHQRGHMMAVCVVLLIWVVVVFGMMLYRRRRKSMIGSGCHLFRLLRIVVVVVGACRRPIDEEVHIG